jgi:GT2 family glycosyltransferase
VSYIFGLDRLTFPWIARLHYLSKELDRSRVVDHVCGAFFLVRADLFDQLHGFDERFFLYFEDVDFSMRARKAGWHSWFAADLHGYHEGGASSRAIPAQRLFYSTRSRILLFAKHRTRSARFIHMLLTVTVEPLTRTAFCLGRRDIGGIRDVYWAFSRLYLWLLSRRWTGPRAAPVGPPD